MAKEGETIPYMAKWIVAAGTKLKMNAFGSEVLNQLRVLDTPHSMSDPCRFKGSKRLPYTVWSRSLSCMCSTIQPVLDCKPKRRYVCINANRADGRGTRQGFPTARVRSTHEPSPVC